MWLWVVLIGSLWVAGECDGRSEVRATFTQPCASGADCPADQCCVNNFQPGGKRQLLHPHGTCMPMGVQGAYCYVRSVSGKPTHMVFSCPCDAGFNCVSLPGHSDPQFGDVGRCT